MQPQLLTSQSEHWCTPPDFLDRVYRVGTVGLDPCSNQHSIVHAKKSVLLPENGLTVPWHSHGFTYCNPPYGRKLKEWVIKAGDEAVQGAEILMLTPARTDTKWYQEEILKTANAVCFLKGRLKFINGLKGTRNNPATFPSLVTYWGGNVDLFAQSFDDIGWVVRL